MGWGSKTTTTSNQSQEQQNYSFNRPIQTAYAAKLQESLAPQYSRLIAEADQPVYGNAQKAMVLNDLNDLASASVKHLSSTLAGRGQLYSGEFDRAAVGIEQARLAKASDFFMGLPGMERQAHLQNLSSALGLANQFAASVPIGQESFSSGTGTSEGEQVTKQSPGLAGLIGSIAGMALGPMTAGLGGGLGGLFTGGGFKGGFNTAYQNAIAPAPLTMGYQGTPIPQAMQPPLAVGAGYGNIPFYQPNANAFTRYGYGK